MASIVILGKACDLIDQHQTQKKSASSTSSPAKEKSNLKPEESNLKEKQVDPFDDDDDEEEEFEAIMTANGNDIALLESKLQAIGRHILRDLGLSIIFCFQIRAFL